MLDWSGKSVQMASVQDFRPLGRHLRRLFFWPASPVRSADELMGHSFGRLKQTVESHRMWGHTVKQLPSAEEIEREIDYDPSTGEFRWRVDKSPTVRAGDRAGSINAKGYLRIDIRGRQYRAQRLAWLLTRGSWPSAVIDHINGDRADNRIVNLRAASQRQNTFNRRCRPSKTGLKGVYPDKSGKFRAKITVAGKRIHLGYFATAVEAHQAYALAAKQHYGEFARS